MQAQMLAPAAVLVGWTLVILFWMFFTRAAGLGKLKIGMKDMPLGGRGLDLEGKLPPQAMWKSHNYSHLLEQPTIFYAAVMILAITGASAVDIRLAWGYVALRIAHSVWQAEVNTIPVRFTFFLLSTLCMVALAVRAIMATLLANPGVIA